MQINKEFLKSLKPCANRYENYLEHNADFSGSFSEFLDLPYLDYTDKTWVAEKILTKNQAVNWAILCAESVVHMFEDKHPDDKILSNCIDFLKTVNDFDNLIDTQVLEIEKHLDIIAAHYVARSANAAFYVLCTVLAANAVYVVLAAARSASCATSAAHYATNAAYNAANAAFYAARSASNSINDDAKENQEALNLQFLKQVTSL